MKIRTIICLLCLAGLNLFAQDNTDKIIEYLGSEKYTTYTSVNPQYIDQLNAKINHGYKIELIDNDKISTYEVLDQIIVKNISDKSESTITIEEFINASKLDSFNILIYKIGWNRSFHTYYRLGSTNYVLTVYSMEYILSKI